MGHGARNPTTPTLAQGLPGWCSAGLSQPGPEPALHWAPPGVRPVRSEECPVITHLSETDGKFRAGSGGLGVSPGRPEGWALHRALMP